MKTFVIKMLGKGGNVEDIPRTAAEWLREPRPSPRWGSKGLGHGTQLSVQGPRRDGPDPRNIRNLTAFSESAFQALFLRGFLSTPSLTGAPTPAVTVSWVTFVRR